MSRKRGNLTRVPVVDAGAKGKNIAKTADGQVVLLENVVPGDVVDVEIYRKKKGFFEGKVTHFHQYSADRVEPVCPHFETCGGCTWQNFSYEAQLKFKEKSVHGAFRRIGKLENFPSFPILGSPKTEYYRNRLDFAFTHRRWVETEELAETDKIIEWQGVGFHVPGRFDKIFDVSRCYLQPDPSNQIRLATRNWAIENLYSFFDARDKKGDLRSLIIRNTTAGQIMVIVVFGQPQRQERIEKLMKFLTDEFPQISSLYYVTNPKLNDSIYDLNHHLFFGSENITEIMNGIEYQIGPKSFFQTNPYQAKNLFLKTKELAQLTGNEIVYDLYTGVGSIALYVADKASKVIGIETVAEAIEFAKENAQRNNIQNTSFFAGDVKQLLTEEFMAINGKPDVVITDPPRIGMDAPVIETLLRVKPARIVYVSCNPATQARDVEMLKDSYKVTAVQPVDMFPHTYHVENIAVLELKY